MIELQNLTYVFPDNTVGIQPTSQKFPSNSRTLLVGANGAGKSTLLRVLAGKTLAKAGSVYLNGMDPFRDCLRGITYLGTEWAGSPTVRRDIPVTLLLSSIGGDAFPERRDQLVEILDIDLTWRMHQCSDGERRRVQMAMGLLRPWDILLLDEVTVDLDVLVRARLLDFLKEETESRDCQVVYATHIFDGLGKWPTDIAHMHMGKLVEVRPYDKSLTDVGTGNSALLELALQWLKDDLKDRGARQPKITWDDIKDNVMGTGYLEKNTENGFGKYFSQSRQT